MLLAIDIGNTNISLGVFNGEKLKATWRMATSLTRTDDEYASFFLDLLERKGIAASEITAAVISSVVPPLTKVFEEVCRRYLGTAALVIEVGVKTGIKILLENPHEVGADRIVNVVAAHRMFGGPVIVIDLGTATTFDVVTKGGEYLGGAIAPGINIAAEALYTHTAKLPRIQIARPQRAVGRNTVAAMQSGVYYGYVSLIEGVVNRIKKEMDGTVKVIATGGLAALFARELPLIEETCPDLTLVGLRYLYEMNRKQETEE